MSRVQYVPFTAQSPLVKNKSRIGARVITTSWLAILFLQYRKWVAVVCGEAIGCNEVPQRGNLKWRTGKNKK